MAVFKFLAPNGNPIVRVLETVPLGANIEGISEDGNSITYSGGSDVYWDDQSPVHRDHSFVFLDEDGAEYHFDQLTKAEEVALAEDLELPND